MPLTQEEYLKRFRRIIEVMYETTKDKNNDYAEENDALANFNEFGSTGILIRISDKFKRIKNCLWFRKAFKVRETVIDSMIDLAVYAVIMIIAYEYEQEQKYPLMTVRPLTAEEARAGAEQIDKNLVNYFPRREAND